MRRENSNFQQHDIVTHWWNNYVKMSKLNHVFSIDSRIIEMSSLLDSIGFICPNARRHPPTYKTTTTTMPSSIMWKWEIPSESIFSKQQNLHFRMRRQQMLNGFLHEWFKNWMGVLSAYGTCVRFIFGTDFTVMFCKSLAIDGFLVIDRLCWKLSERAKALSSVAHVNELRRVLNGGYSAAFWGGLPTNLWKVVRASLDKCLALNEPQQGAITPKRTHCTLNQLKWITMKAEY